MTEGAGGGKSWASPFVVHNSTQKGLRKEMASGFLSCFSFPRCFLFYFFFSGGSWQWAFEQAAAEEAWGTRGDGWGCVLCTTSHSFLIPRLWSYWARLWALVSSGVTALCPFVQCWFGLVSVEEVGSSWGWLWAPVPWWSQLPVGCVFSSGKCASSKARQEKEQGTD